MGEASIYGSRWASLVPIAFITYSLAYVDRANYSIGSAGGLASDLAISGRRMRCSARCSSSATSCSRYRLPGMPRRAAPSG